MVNGISHVLNVIEIIVIRLRYSHNNNVTYNLNKKNADHLPFEDHLIGRNKISKEAMEDYHHFQLSPFVPKGGAKKFNRTFFPSSLNG